jgi:hypothetical protein
LKLERCSDRIGLYLCCGEVGHFPIVVDYQLMVRRSQSDEACCPSVVFRTEFGVEKAWGLSKFTTMESIIKEGGYSRAHDDSMTFGCLIYPVKGCLWGRPSRRSTVATAGIPTLPVAALVAARNTSEPRLSSLSLGSNQRPAAVAVTG